MLSCLLLVSSLFPSQPATPAAPRPAPVAMVRAALTDISDLHNPTSGSVTDAVGQALAQLRAERSSPLLRR